MTFQLIDDHSRYAVASHVAWSETAADATIVFDKAVFDKAVFDKAVFDKAVFDKAVFDKAVVDKAVFDKAVVAHGVPQRLLSDNGIALNPSGRGHLGRLVVHVMTLGTEPITGKPYKPTTQGKNERFHLTLFRYLDKQPLATTLDELQAQVDAFDHIYNTERGDQGLPGRITPLAAWHATAKAEAPRPTHARFVRHHPPRIPPAPGPVPVDLPDDTHVEKLSSVGAFMLDKVFYMVGARYGFHQVLVITDGNEPGDKITITDLRGEILIEHTRPAPGVTHVGNGRRPGTRPNTGETSPKS